MNKVITIEYKSKEKAEEVIDKMSELIEQYGHATIADLYEIVDKNKDIEYMDYKYGWTDISKIHMKTKRNGTCYIKFGKPLIVF